MYSHCEIHLPSARVSYLNSCSRYLTSQKGTSSLLKHSRFFEFFSEILKQSLSPIGLRREWGRWWGSRRKRQWPGTTWTQSEAAALLDESSQETLETSYSQESDEGVGQPLNVLLENESTRQWEVEGFRVVISRVSAIFWDAPSKVEVGQRAKHQGQGRGLWRKCCFSNISFTLSPPSKGSQPIHTHFQRSSQHNRPRTPRPPLMVIFRHFFTPLFSFAIDSYIDETDFTLGLSHKYHF